MGTSSTSLIVFVEELGSASGFGIKLKYISRILRIPLCISLTGEVEQLSVVGISFERRSKLGGREIEKATSSRRFIKGPTSCLLYTSRCV